VDGFFSWGGGGGEEETPGHGLLSRFLQDDASLRTTSFRHGLHGAVGMVYI
jgi:hypothetical protein